MRLIDADALKEKLVKIQGNIVNKSDAWKPAYLLILDEYIKMLDEMPSATHDATHDAFDILNAYDNGYSKGRVDALSEAQQIKDYCKNDCDALHEAYNRGFSKGMENVLIAEECKKKYCDINRKMEEQAKKQMEDYCKNDCNTTKEVAIAVTNYLYKHEMSKEQKIENSEMTREEIWDKIIQDLKTLDQEADNKDYVPYMTDALSMIALRLYYTDVTNGTIKQEDKSHMWDLVDDLGSYSIKGETIMYLPEYQELTALMRKVL